MWPDHLPSLWDILRAVPHSKPDDSSFGPEFFAAIIGALVGGLMALLVQLLGFWFQIFERNRTTQREREEEEKRQRDREIVHAFSILVKINRAHTTIMDMKNHLHRGVLTAIKERMRYALAIKAFSSDPEPFRFSIDELALVRKMREADILNELLDLPFVHDMYIDNMRYHREECFKMADLAKDVKLSKDGKAQTFYSEADKARIEILVHQLDEIVLHLYGRSLGDFSYVNNLFFDIQNRFLEYFGDKEFGFRWQVSRVPEVPRSSRARR